MKILKRILIVLGIIILLIVIVGLILPAKVTIEKSIVINAPEATVFEQVNTLKNWEKWSPWAKMDPTAKVVYNDIPSGNGASYSWEGEKIMKGTMTLADVKEYSHITEKMLFNGKDSAQATMDFVKEGKGVKVTWKMDMDNGWNVFGRLATAIFVKGMMEDAFEQGLKDMKDVAEKAPVVSSDAKEYKVVEIQTQPGMALGIDATCTEATVGETLGKSYGEIMAYMGKNGLKQNGPAFAIYKNWGAKVELTACIPVDKKNTGSGNIKLVETKAGNAVKVDYYGPYAGSVAAHNAIDAWAKANSKTIVGAPWEVYVNDPTTVKPEEIHTEVIYPIQ